MPACMPKQPLAKPMNCEGAEKDKVIGVVEWTMMVTLGIQAPPKVGTPAADSEPRSPALADCRAKEPATKYLTTEFYLMENLSDPIILGRPELSHLGLMLEPPDEQGRLWVQFTTMNLRIPVIMPGMGNAPVFRIEEPQVIAGPDLREIPVVISDSDYQYYTH